MMTIGYQLGHVAIVRRNFEKVILGIIFISLLPCSLRCSKRGARSRSPAL